MWRCALAVALGLVAGCASGDSVPRESNGDRDTPLVVVGFSPLAWAVEQVGGDAVLVVDLTPAGSEPHDLELTPNQVEDLVRSDLVIVMGGFQPAVEDAASERDSDEVLDVRDSIATFIGNEGDDPHAWLDPIAMIEIAKGIEARLVAIVPTEATSISQRADAVIANLQSLDNDYATTLARCDRRDLITAHDAFGWLARRYQLTAVPIAGTSPDVEPTADHLAEVADRARSGRATTVFAETLASSEVARTLADEAGGLDVATLDPIEASSEISEDEPNGYVDRMRANLAAISSGLGCG